MAALPWQLKVKQSEPEPLRELALEVPREVGAPSESAKHEVFAAGEPGGEAGELLVAEGHPLRRFELVAV